LVINKNFEKKVIHEAEALGLPRQFPRVGPEAVLGIEVNPYAVELARVTVWIGEIQWMLENGFGVAKNPILRPLDQIECRDAIVNEDGSEPAWPKADAIIGNPPFLGAKLMNRKLGKDYTQRLRDCYAGRLPGFTDLVCYWFEKARAEAAEGRASYVGLVATNSIAKNTNLPVMRRITRDLAIHRAWRDEPWILDGAAVRVSIVCFARPDVDTNVQLDGRPVTSINPDLTSGTDLSNVKRMLENTGASFLGIQKSGPLDVPGELARRWMSMPLNPNGWSNASVLKPYWNGDDLAGRPRDVWFIDLPRGLHESEAALFQAPFEYLISVRYDPDDDSNTKTFKEARATARDSHAAAYWWEPYWPRPEMRSLIESLPRYMVTPETSEYRLFIWLKYPVLPDKSLIVIARSDDLTFGILHSRFHEAWSTRIGNRIGKGNQRRYNSSFIFETFPFPAGMTMNLADDQRLAHPLAAPIAAAAARLAALREAYLKPSDLTIEVPEPAPGFPPRLIGRDTASVAELSRRTLTNLYNANPAWLQHAHRELDEAVAAAYGWDWPLSDDQILARLLELNATRAQSE